MTKTLLRLSEVEVRVGSLLTRKGYENDGNIHIHEYVYQYIYTHTYIYLGCGDSYIGA